MEERRGDVADLMGGGSLSSSQWLVATGEWARISSGRASRRQFARPNADVDLRRSAPRPRPHQLLLCSSSTSPAKNNLQYSLDRADQYRTAAGFVDST